MNPLKHFRNVNANLSYKQSFFVYATAALMFIPIYVTLILGVVALATAALMFAASKPINSLFGFLQYHLNNSLDSVTDFVNDLPKYQAVAFAPVALVAALVISPLALVSGIIARAAAAYVVACRRIPVYAASMFFDSNSPEYQDYMDRTGNDIITDSKIGLYISSVYKGTMNCFKAIGKTFDVVLRPTANEQTDKSQVITSSREKSDSDSDYKYPHPGEGSAFVAVTPAYTDSVRMRNGYFTEDSQNIWRYPDPEASESDIRKFII